MSDEQDDEASEFRMAYCMKCNRTHAFGFDGFSGATLELPTCQAMKNIEELTDMLREAGRRIEEWGDSIHEPSRGQMLTHALLQGAYAGEIQAAQMRDCPYDDYDYSWAWRTGFDLGRRIDGLRRAIAGIVETSLEALYA